jgi:hypothetical protein
MAIWLLFVVIRKPKQFFFIISCIQVTVLMMMLLERFIPGNLVHPFFIVLMLLIGMSKSIGFIPSLVLNQYFEWSEDQCWMSIWGSILWMGDPLVIFLYNLITNTFHCNWEVYLTTVSFSLIALIVSIGWEVLLDEISPIQHTE